MDTTSEAGPSRSSSSSSLSRKSSTSSIKGKERAIEPVDGISGDHTTSLAGGDSDDDEDIDEVSARQSNDGAEAGREGVSGDEDEESSDDEAYEDEEP